MRSRLGVLAGISIVAVLLMASFALPIREWRTGEMPLEPLAYQPAGNAPAFAARFWIDTDAACGTGARRDPDDCIALWTLVRAAGDRIAGISTVFGNAPLDVTDPTTRELIEMLRRDGAPAITVHRGCAAALRDPGCARGADAHRALRDALAAEALTVVALGPLTNLAAVLEREPALAARVSRVIAVMGRRPGHRFHPTENRSPRAMLFGHGPVFRDLNAALDIAAVEVIVRAGVPLTLVPYTVARRVQFTAHSLDRLAAAGRAGAWVAARSRDWLEFWRRDVGADGFYPFDLMAAIYVRAPQRFRCAEVKAWVGRDPLFAWFDRAPALLVTQDDDVPDDARAQGAALYCDDLIPGTHADFT